MFSKLLVSFVLFTLNLVPGYFYCVSRSEVCPFHPEPESYCNCDQSMYVPLVQSRVADPRAIAAHELAHQMLPLMSFLEERLKDPEVRVALFGDQPSEELSEPGVHPKVLPDVLATEKRPQETPETTSDSVLDIPPSQLGKNKAPQLEEPKAERNLPEIQETSTLQLPSEDFTQAPTTTPKPLITTQVPQTNPNSRRSNRGLSNLFSFHERTQEQMPR